MKKIAFNLIFVLFFFGNAISQDLDVVTIEKHRRDSTALANLASNKSFQTGEYLRYEAKYGVIKGGEAKLLTNIKAIGDSYYYHFKAIAKNAGFAGNFYFLEDTYQSYVNIVTGLPIKATRDIKEESYRKYNELIFNREKNEIISTNKGIVKVKPNIVDILSGFYYARRFLFNDLKKNQVIVINTYFDDEFFPVKLKYKKREKISSNFGRVQCIKLVPVIEKGSTFEKEKDLQIWITDDDAHILVKLKADLTIGSAKMVLSEYKNIVESSILNKKKEAE